MLHLPGKDDQGVYLFHPSPASIQFLLVGSIIHLDVLGHLKGGTSLLFEGLFLLVVDIPHQGIGHLQDIDLLMLDEDHLQLLGIDLLHLHEDDLLMDEGLHHLCVVGLLLHVVGLRFKAVGAQLLHCVIGDHHLLVVAGYHLLPHATEDPLLLHDAGDHLLPCAAGGLLPQLAIGDLLCAVEYLLPPHGAEYHLLLHVAEYHLLPHIVECHLLLHVGEHHLLLHAGEHHLLLHVVEYHLLPHVSGLLSGIVLYLLQDIGPCLLVDCLRIGLNCKETLLCIRLEIMVLILKYFHRQRKARRDSSRETDSRSNGFRSKKQQQEYASERDSEKRSLVHDALHREVADRSGLTRGADHVPRQRPVPSRSSSHDSKDQIDNDCSILSEHSSEWSGSPSHLRTRNSGRNRLSESTAKQTGKRMPHDMSGMNDDDEPAGLVRSRAYHKTDSSPKKGKDSAADMKKSRFRANEFDEQEYSNNGLAIGHSPGTQGHPSNMISKKESEQKSETDLTKRHSGQVSESPNDMEYGLGVHSEKQPKLRSDAYRDSHHEADSVKKSKRKIDISSHSDSEETDTLKYKSTERRRHKKSDKHRRFSDGTSESDSDIEEKKEAKRRRKDERRLRKEEKRLRREEKHRKKLERHGAKHKLKSMDTVTPPSDLENQNHDDAGRSDAEPADSEEKKLEIQLREKALESLRARKGIRH
ncbi:serine/arginine repetitive matrix protein 1 [Canna indica]|uniref:Serine/arginine repetitive matrix protein 1 n=1 Tax=Canna indica TaxID=4628 RepID=A0AAQ3QBI6_9LILI|nr:serine/arginine repetitive matrix protein 1 [Canna indica]